MSIEDFVCFQPGGRVWKHKFLSYWVVYFPDQKRLPISPLPATMLIIKSIGSISLCSLKNKSCHLLMHIWTFKHLQNAFEKRSPVHCHLKRNQLKRWLNIYTWYKFGNKSFVLITPPLSCQGCPACCWQLLATSLPLGIWPTMLAFEFPVPVAH